MRRRYRRIVCIAVISSLLCCGCVSRNGSLESTEQASGFAAANEDERKLFDDYTNELFRNEMKGNLINLHYTLSNPKEYGITDYEISLGSVSEEEIRQGAVQLENMKASLKEFDSSALTDKQRLTLDILKDYCERELNAYDMIYYGEPLKPTTGTTSELPVLLAEYDFHCQSDVTDYLTLLGCVDEYFADILAFEEEKAKKGLFMSDEAVDTLVESCRNFIADPEKNFLITSFEHRVDELTDLPEEKRETYKANNRTLVETEVIPAYEEVIASMTELKGEGKNTGGLCNFPKGKEYYEYLVKCSTGSDKSIKELQRITEEQRNADITNLQQTIAKDPSLLTLSETAEVIAEDPVAVLTDLQEKLLADFPSAATAEFEVNYIDESLEDALAPAFYLTAPIDNTNHNVIYINRASGYEGVQLFTTLAHEGYPGHLYQTTGSYAAGLEPVRCMLNYAGYVEGWATYVEMISYNYLDLQAEISDILMYNQSALLSLYATIDMGIHYDNWTIEQTKEFLSKYGIYDEQVIKDIFQLIVQEPSHYLKYYIGYVEFLQLKEEMKDAWGNDYSDKRFHQKVIEAGPMPFYILEDYMLAS